MKEINKIYVSQFLSGFAMIASFTPLYFLSNGITQSQLGLLIAANILTLSIFDIPTGAIADVFGHKLSVFLGTLIWSLSYLLLYVGNGFGVYLVSMIIGGVGLALISGALTSLTYDILDRQGMKDDFQKVYSRQNGIFLLASVISAALGGFIYQYQPKLIFLTAFLFTFLGSLSVLFIRWNFTGKQPSFIAYMQKMKSGFFVTVRNPALIALVVISVGLVFGIMVINNIKQPFFVTLGYSVPQIGFITALVSGLSAVLYLYSSAVLKRIGNIPGLIYISLVSGISLLLVYIAPVGIATACIILYQLTPSLRDPAITHLQQQYIAHDVRATANSTINFLTRVVVAVGLPLWGLVIDRMGIKVNLVYLMILTEMITACGLLLYRFSSSVRTSTGDQTTQ